MRQERTEPTPGFEPNQVTLDEAVARAGGSDAWEQLDRADRAWVRMTGTTPPARSTLTGALQSVAQNGGSTSTDGEILAVAYAEWRRSMQADASAGAAVQPIDTVSSLPPADRYSSDDILEHHVSAFERDYAGSMRRLRGELIALKDASERTLHFDGGKPRDPLEKWVSNALKVGARGVGIQKLMLDESLAAAKTVINAMNDMPAPSRKMAFSAEQVNDFALAVRHEFDVRVTASPGLQERTRVAVEKGMREQATQLGIPASELLSHADETRERMFVGALNDTVRTAARQWYDDAPDASKAGAFSVFTRGLGPEGERVKLSASWRAVSAVLLAEVAPGQVPEIGEPTEGARQGIPPMFVGPLPPSMVRQIGEVGVELDRRLAALPVAQATPLQGADSGRIDGLTLEAKAALMQDSRVREFVSSQLDEVASDLGAETAVGLMRAEVGFRAGPSADNVSHVPVAPVRDGAIDQARAQVQRWNEPASGPRSPRAQESEQGSMGF